MTLSVSETSLVPNISQIHSECNQIVIHDEDDNSDILDVEEYRPNGVSFDHAAVNIDNSQDVILGPVTQFNVSGNVTIYSNGNSANGEALPEPAVINQEQTQTRINLTNGVKLGKCEKTDSEDQDVRVVDKNKKVIKIFLLISFALLVIIGIVILVLHYTNNIFNNSDSGFTPTEPGTRYPNLGDHQVIDRTQWGGRAPKSIISITSPVPMIIIKHTGGGQCFSFDVCAGKVQTIQSASVREGLSDIKYSFLIANDGNIYVGRGWDVQPAQRNDTIDIAFMGSYAYDELTSSMIDAALKLIEYGVQNNKVSEDYIIVAHNQTMAVESPGTNVYKEMVNWPHYDGGIYIGARLGSLIKKNY